ncbi:baseplate J/gp47 family protein [Paenibacillus glycinis]|uniref:Baseplate J protein n=1 Tax=Paenibacillus glycinis TaxID=2697035 RepID=A0ABW9XNU5_9BACL|nr:baseplate J/gp47 family protein [Paenibacillus glycinis]NBD24315.1 baseplate J protein [Paenibacillus glycinis]
MYEDRTFEAMLQEMLSGVPAGTDKREGSIIYDALAPAAKKLAEAYAELARSNRLAHAQTSSGEELRLRGADFGIDPRPASAAVRLGLFYDAAGAPLDVPVESRYSAGGLNFIAAGQIGVGRFRLVCETAGAAGNVPAGTLLPLDYVDKLASAAIGDVLAAGEDEESDESFRTRFFAHVRTPPTSGNRAAYRNWALEVPGVGDAYVVPCWNGPNTVKVYVLGADRTSAGAGVVQAVKDYIDPDTGLGEGMGEGAAPAGALTTVVAAPAVNVNVTASITLSGSRTPAQVDADFGDALTSYLAGIAYGDDPRPKYARIGTMLLDTAGVADYANLLVNGGTTNVTVAEGAVAVKGTVTLT